MTSARAAALVAAVVLQACAVDEAAEVAAYRTVLDRGLEGDPTPPAASEKLDLRTAMRLANAADEALAAQGEAYVRALVARRRAAAAFLPTITLSSRFFARERLGHADTTSRGVDLPLNAAMAVDPVTDTANLRVAELSARAQRARLLSAQDDLLLDVGRAHFTVLLAERRADVLRSSITVQQARVDDARARTEAGLQRPLDVALAESRAADARAQLVDAERVIRNGRTALAFLTAFELGTMPLDDALDVPAEPPSADELVTVAFTRLPEIRAADQDVAAAAAAADAAYGQYWPGLSLDLSAFFTRDSAPTDVAWTSFLDLNLPLFRAGLIEADVRDALSRLREAGLGALRARRVARRSVEIARDTLLSLALRIQALEVRLEAARRSFDLADAQWAAGLASSLERLVAQDELLTVQLDMVSAVLEHKMRYLELLQAAGRLHEIAGLERVPEDDDAEAR